jgi:hypothetical protein
LLALSCAGVLAPGRAASSPIRFKGDGLVYGTASGLVRQVVYADLDRDGHPDLIALNADGCYHSSWYDVTVRRGTATGFETTIRSWRVGSLVVPVPYDHFAIADLDGDGWMDAVVSTTYELYVLHNVAGAFEAPMGIGVESNDNGPIAVADVNDDGRADIIYAPTTKNVVRVLLGSGGLAFAPGPTFSTRVEPTLLSTVDLDGNHVPDIVVGAKDTSTVIMCYGGGSMVPSDFLAGGAFVAGDLDHNGAPDIVSKPFVHLNRGDGVFVTPVPHGVDTPVSAADVDGDGNPDIVGMPPQDIGRSQVLQVALGRGNGTFLAPVSSPRMDSSPQAPIVADLDHDGILDVAFASSNSQYVDVMLGIGQARFQQSQFMSLPETPTTLVLGHLNDDTIPDLVVTAGSTIRVLLSAPGGGYVPSAPVSAPATISGLACGDFNADGRDDLVAYYAGGSSFWIWLTQSDGTPGARIDKAPISEMIAIASLSVTDVDRDGRADLFLTGYVTGYVPYSYYLHGLGAGTFQPYLRLPYIANVLLEDVTGDGIPDAIGYAAGGASYVLRQLPAVPPGTFSASAMSDTLLDPYEFIAVARIDDDAFPDVFVHHRDNCSPLCYTCSDTVFWRRNLGDGTFAAPVQVPSAWLGSTADLDGDGHPDQLAFGVAAFVERGHGDGTFDPVEGFSLVRASGGGRGSVAADFNGDGLLDVCTAATGGLLFAINQSPGSVSVGPALPPGPSPKLTSVALGIRAWPNPARAGARLRLDLPSAGPATLELFGIDGRRWMEHAFEATAGPFELPLASAGRLPPGVYLARVRQGGSEAITRFCVVR